MGVLYATLFKWSSVSPNLVKHEMYRRRKWLHSQLKWRIFLPHYSFHTQFTAFLRLRVVKTSSFEAFRETPPPTTNHTHIHTNAHF